jgi:hypothetical protein
MNGLALDHDSQLELTFIGLVFPQGPISMLQHVFTGTDRRTTEGPPLLIS